MKHLAPLLLAFAAVAGAAQASPVSGMWLTQTNAGVVEISDCGSGVCGKLVTSEHIKHDPGALDELNKTVSLRGRPLKGLMLFEGMTGGPKIWTGKVYSPTKGQIYSGQVTLVNSETLKLRGCIVFPLCDTQTWTRQR